ncbi:hypothetical protein [Pedobacter faecalis]|uniref:hypothetical protein n=1 Tax=Pedobacter faecalis TaxID=3041495 RepID=UPI00254E1723|nr:hypothetical protein [Pedobacter sp. ELA7]
MRIAYYFLWFLSVLQLLALFVVPFGGVRAIVDSLATGKFSQPEYAASYFLLLNRILAYLYHASLFLAILTPLAYKIEARRKYKYGIVLALIALVVQVSGYRLLVLLAT